MQIIGQKNNLEIINRWETLPNFIIIQGDKHTGKKFFTLYLCKKFKLHYVSVDKGVKNVRNLINVMSKDTNTLYHFKNFDEATLQAKNALLKITEEPVRGNYIVITGGPQIKTLESRARKIVMEPYSYEELKDYMSSIFDQEDCFKLYNAGINTPAKINFYKEYEHLKALLDYAYDIFSKLTYLTPTTYIPLLGRFEDRYENGKIDACMLFLNMLINIIENTIKDKRYYSYKPILEKLIESKRSLEREPTLKRKMVLFKLFYEISSERN